MADNETSEQWDWNITLSHYYAIKLIVSVLTLATFTYGATSWYILTKLRNYKNYVFLNAILINFLLGTAEALYYFLDVDFAIAYYFLFKYLRTAKTHWLVVVSHMFYVDFVKIFNGNIQRRYLKSSLFGWGLSLVTAAFFTCPYISELIFSFLGADVPFFMTVIIVFVYFGNQVVPVTINCLFYIIIVFSLFRSFNTRAHTTSDIWRRLYIATLIFILSDVLLLYDNFIEFVFDISPAVRFFIKVLTISNPLVLDVFFVILRSNRKIWYDYYVNKLNQRRRDNDINMRERIARGSGDSRPEVLDV